MDFNSGNQVWSRWTFKVTQPFGTIQAPNFTEVKENCARFGRKFFGSPSEMRIIQTSKGWQVQVRTEGHPAHDPAYVRYVTEQWERFFILSFGVGTVTTCEVRWEAGSRQDGRPAPQLVLIPPVSEGAPYGR